MFLRKRLVPMSCRLDEGLRQGYVVFVDLLASETCMEANWILIGLCAGSVMGRM